MRVVFVGDEPSVLADAQRKLVGVGGPWEVVLAGSGAEALNAVSRTPAEVVACDSRLPGNTGADVLERVQSRGRPRCA